MYGETPAAADLEIRYCGYRECARPLEYDGRGRPPEYCRDRRWPDGKSCRQLAAADRAAERIAGLEVPLSAFRSAGDRLAAVASPLARQLTEVVDAIAQVQDGALARVAAAEQAAQAAAERATQAEAATEAAQRAEAQARAGQQRAETAAQEATQRAQTTIQEAEQRAQAAIGQAEQRLRETRSAAEEQLQRAWRQVAEADHARGQAETAAAAAEQRAAEQRQAHEAAAQRAAQAEADQAALAAECALLTRRLAEQQQQVAVAQERARAAEGEARRWREQPAETGKPRLARARLRRARTGRDGR